jgi:RED-like protein N-terminal region
LSQSQATLSTNDIVINKLAQILSYLRQGKNQSKKAKKLKEKAGMENAPMPAKQRMEDSIYGDIGDYVASNKNNSDGLVNALIILVDYLTNFIIIHANSREKKGGPYFAKPALDDEGDNREPFKLSFAEALTGRSSDSRADSTSDRP